MISLDTSFAALARFDARQLFDFSVKLPSQNPDYQAICWLVNQQYLNTQEAANLIEELAEEVIVSLLSVRALIVWGTGLLAFVIGIVAS